MNPEKYKKIVKFYENKSKAKVDTMKWIGEIENA